MKKPASRTTEVSSNAEVSTNAEVSASSCPSSLPAPENEEERGGQGSDSSANKAVETVADHSYSVSSPKTLKRKYNRMSESFQKYKRKMKLEKQTTRRLKTKVTTLKGVTREIK